MNRFLSGSSSSVSTTAGTSLGLEVSGNEHYWQLQPARQMERGPPLRRQVGQHHLLTTHEVVELLVFRVHWK